jgi:transposase
MTPWLVHELRNLGREVVGLDARHARAALKMQINKIAPLTSRPLQNV